MGAAAVAGDFALGREQVDDGQVLGGRLQEGRVRRQEVTADVAGVPPLGTQVGEPPHR